MVDKNLSQAACLFFLFFSIKHKEMNCAGGLCGLWALGQWLILGWINSNNLNIAADLILRGEQACDL